VCLSTMHPQAGEAGEEIEATERALAQDSKNYHVWSYRCVVCSARVCVCVCVHIVLLSSLHVCVDTTGSGC
jgi:hypothetical protein